ncbi:putative ribonuclease H-like domain-containing protein [Senna tora]|uniref:Putative ribonuclease H-like domain-containing protein n=1 Tax=Senna tora TaxID=362788 RepID=A0A834XAZ2_9FABA|nr:putative ribonuclease H-like domain-containing protein [Senna tora]
MDGTIKAPEEDAIEFKKWKPDDSMRYLVNNGPKFYQVQRQTVSLEQGSGTITGYFNKLNRCWDELNRIKAVPKCTCELCTCEVNKRLDAHDSDIKLCQFLMGLHLMYDALKGQIMNLDPLPSVNKAFSMVVRQETQKEVNLAFKNVESSAMMARAGSSRNENFGRRTDDKKTNKNTKFCDHCNQNSHTREGCFKIIGFPDWYKDLKEQKKKAGKRNVAANAVANTPMKLPKDKEKIDLVGVLPALQEITKMVKHKAEEHVNFANLKKFDQKTRKTLIEGKVTGNLYILRQSDSSRMIGKYNTPLSFACRFLNSNTIHDVMLWHHRLGHATLDTIKHVGCIKFNSIDVLPNVCDIFHLAKQHRLSFPKSNTNFTKIFDLVHMDLWGPYKYQSITNMAHYFLTIVDDYSRAVWTFLLPDKTLVKKQ